MHDMPRGRGEVIEIGGALSQGAGGALSQEASRAVPLAEQPSDGMPQRPALWAS